MSREPKWLSNAIVLTLHERLLAEFGGAPGILDQRLLESALAAPRNCWAYEQASLFGLAASYAHALTRTHPFADGNKRIALTAAGLFLELNGFRLVAPEHEAVKATAALSNQELDQAAFALWLKESSLVHPSPRRPKAIRRSPQGPRGKK